MPFYDYRCNACSHEVRILQKRTAPGPEHCELCDTGKMEKYIGGCSFALAGGGWFEDGYSAPSSDTSHTSDSTD
ncbi:MAG: transcriptional regulator [Legionellales bacterium]|nr:transcriptional regulator [Legionellales bacterium]